MEIQLTITADCILKCDAGAERLLKRSEEVTYDTGTCHIIALDAEDERVYCPVGIPFLQEHTNYNDVIHGAD